MIVFSQGVIDADGFCYKVSHPWLSYSSLPVQPQAIEHPIGIDPRLAGKTLPLASVPDSKAYASPETRLPPRDGLQSALPGVVDPALD